MHRKFLISYDFCGIIEQNKIIFMSLKIIDISRDIQKLSAEGTSNRWAKMKEFQLVKKKFSG